MAQAMAQAKVTLRKSFLDKGIEESDFSKRAIRVIIQHIHDDGGVFLGIGVISHAPTGAKQALREHAQQHRDCNWVVSLCVTDSEDRRILTKVHKKAKDCVQEIAGWILDDFPRNYQPSRPGHNHNVVALASRDVSYRLNILKNVDEILVKINRVLGQHPNSKFYIGITSGPDATTAMRKRRTNYKNAELKGIKCMIAVYQSHDQGECRDIERELTDHYKDETNPYTARCLNHVRGGGGGTTTQTWSFVYFGLT